MTPLNSTVFPNTTVFLFVSNEIVRAAGADDADELGDVLPDGLRDADGEVLVDGLRDAEADVLGLVDADWLALPDAWAHVMVAVPCGSVPRASSLSLSAHASTAVVPCCGERSAKLNPPEVSVPPSVWSA